jgi:adenine-specific DNA-methyltransferase
VRELLDELFGIDNYVAQIQFAKNSGQTTTLLSVDVDYIIWYAKDKKCLKYRQLYYDKTINNEYGERYDQARLPDGRIKRKRSMNPRLAT